MLSLSKTLLLAAALATAGVSANPIDPSASDLILRCAPIRCAVHETCKVIDGKPQCVSKYPVKCGNAVCAEGLTCCNPSCSMCVKPGMACTQQVCTPLALPTLPPTEPNPVVPPRNPDDPLPVPPGSQRCGPSICKPGTECCNESCGICVKPGQGCTKQFCLPKGEVCGKTVCAHGLVCCNSSCGICAPPDGACTQQYCLDEN
ncbi:hypothetical protein VTJ49DRAFT_7359 [Mycothermus thermophilus]|uniref:Uncharacterized protein n=1 Tax=Humicola insolens TaxID=85995 RepID=A0ABR3VGZ2_HUMIN